MRIHLIAGARPNFMKIGPLYHALHATDWAEPVIVHTGQHYDPEMSGTFFTDLRLPPPSFHLGIHQNSHVEQIAAMMAAYKNLCQQNPPDWVVVAGDVNSTLAAALCAQKKGLPLAHLESGLRSRDRAMPEEINRILTDALSDLLWTPSPDADENLLREGIAPERIERVGNIMIDAYRLLEPTIKAAGMSRRLGLAPRNYGVITLHRPSNVDDATRLASIAASLIAVSREHCPLIFPLHPRTRRALETFGLMSGLESGRIRLLPPQSYIPFMSLVEDSALVITDSGGIQEETTYLGIPCLTLRKNTERPITITHGTNQLVEPEDLDAAVRKISGGRRPARPPELWDGNTAQRVAESLARRR
jgi:UDP-N-acetylglucosamine 2-epimerase (non-hydrolysing)